MRTSSSPRSKIVTSLIASLATSALLACTQAAGETCQIDSDCEDGLVCRRESSAERGLCLQREKFPDAGEVAGDPVLPPDMPEDDAGAATAGSSG